MAKKKPQETPAVTLTENAILPSERPKPKANKLRNSAYSATFAETGKGKKPKGKEAPQEAPQAPATPPAAPKLPKAVKIAKPAKPAPAPAPWIPEKPYVELVDASGEVKGYAKENNGPVTVNLWVAYTLAGTPAGYSLTSASAATNYGKKHGCKVSPRDVT